MGNTAIATARAANAPTVTLPTDGLSIIYENISPHLVALIRPCDDEGNDIPNESTVYGIFVDGDQNFESSWQTPFENSNPEHKLPTLMASIQSGQMVDSLGTVSKAIKDFSDTAADLVDPLLSTLKDQASSLKGKTNLTKVNTRQIFLSTQSLRLNLTLYFAAYADAKIEVENQISLLQQWALPQTLSKDSLSQNVINHGLEGLFPSVIPPYVSLTLHGKTYTPLIVESVQAPLNCPVDSNGNRISAQIQINLITLTAWDRGDVIQLYK
ncbi:hypothetical protein [Acinetobacter sp.]|uniref:hypothetical protein n=1 Tax=Acinetobacter sp. TaxID=472 RepID=UPI0031D034E8